MKPYYKDDAVTTMNELRELVARGIERGWIRVRVDRELKTEAYLRRKERAKYRANGLTARGTVPKKKRRAELAGAKDKTEYHRNYMRLRRAEK